jgi:hypothetical protein
LHLVDVTSNDPIREEPDVSILESMGNNMVNLQVVLDKAVDVPISMGPSLVLEIRNDDDAAPPTEPNSGDPCASTTSSRYGGGSFWEGVDPQMAPQLWISRCRPEQGFAQLRR